MALRNGVYRTRRIVLYVILVCILLLLMFALKGCVSKLIGSKGNSLGDVVDRDNDQQKVIVNKDLATIFDENLELEVGKPSKGEILDYYGYSTSGNTKYFKVKYKEKIGFISSEVSEIIEKNQINSVINHEVSSNETFESIANKYTIDKEILKIFNQAKTQEPSSGITLRIPLKNANIDSEFDFNNNGYTDSRDFLIGALRDEYFNPEFIEDQSIQGYAPQNLGGSVDVLIRAFTEAGYDIREMIKEDMMAHPDNYQYKTNIEDESFRDIDILHTFISSYAKTLSVDITKSSEWAEGDIVFFKDQKHVGIVLGVPGPKGQPLIIHHHAKNRDYDITSKDGFSISSHYRINGSLLPRELLIKYSQNSERVKNKNRVEKPLPQESEQNYYDYNEDDQTYYQDVEEETIEEDNEDDEQ